MDSTILFMSLIGLLVGLGILYLVIQFAVFNATKDIREGITTIKRSMIFDLRKKGFTRDEIIDILHDQDSDFNERVLSYKTPEQLKEYEKAIQQLSNNK